MLSCSVNVVLGYLAQARLEWIAVDILSIMFTLGAMCSTTFFFSKTQCVFILTSLNLRSYFRSLYPSYWFIHSLVILKPVQLYWQQQSLNFCDKFDWFDVKKQQINKQDSFQLVEKFVKHNFDFFDRSDEQQYQRLNSRQNFTQIWHDNVCKSKLAVFWSLD